MNNTQTELLCVGDEVLCRTQHSGLQTFTVMAVTEGGTYVLIRLSGWYLNAQWCPAGHIIGKVIR